MSKMIRLEDDEIEDVEIEDVCDIINIVNILFKKYDYRTIINEEDKYILNISSLMYLIY